MAFNEDVSFIEYPVDQPTQDFVTNFDTIGGTTDVVLVTVDGVLTDTPESSYTVQQINHTTWRVTPEVQTGSVVRLYRVTNLDDMMHVFTAGAKFIARNMDSNFKQIRHAQQEVRDAFDFLEYNTLGVVEAAKDATELANTATQTANDAAAHVDSKLQEFDNAINTIVVNDGVPALAVSDASRETQQQVNYNGGSKWHSRVDGYLENERAVLANGDIVKSTIPNNTNDPNVDMAGWDRLPDTNSIFNTVNVLDFIPKSQYPHILNNQPNLQDATAITEGFNMAALYARTYMKEPTFIVPSGEYATNDTVLIDLPNGSNIQFNGVIASNVIAKPAVVIGSYTANRFYYNFENVSVYHRDLQASITSDTDKLGVGVLLMNIVAAKGNIKRANGFSNGVLMDASQWNGGSSYNHVTLGFLKDNVYCLRLKMTLPNGYTNENTFYGGSMGHSSAFPFTGQEVDIKVDAGSETQALNNNLFFRPSLESNNVDTKAAVLEGNNNQIYMPRIENSQNYGSFLIVFGTTSNTCAVFGMGFGLKNANIQDNGVNNKFQTSATMSLKSDPVAGRAVLELQNTASNVGKVLLAKNTGGTENFTLYGSGVVESSSHVYAQNGLRWLTGSGTKTDRGLFIGSTVPNGNVTASVGSLYVSTATSKLYTKKLGSGNTGWVELQEVQSGTTAARPTTNLTIGMNYFDVTLGKPIWVKDATTPVWVDASGANV